MAQVISYDIIEEKIDNTAFLASSSNVSLPSKKSDNHGLYGFDYTP